MLDKSPRFLLLGGSGMLGRAWRELCDREGIAVDAPRRDQVDLSQPRSVEQAVMGAYTAVINCAAWTDVDGAEAHEADAAALNGEAVGVLARACADAGTLLVHYSTDYVFNGEETQPYPTDAPIEPLNAYGRTKALGEQAIHKAGGPHLIVRTSWLYAPWGSNFVLTMARLTREKPQLRVVNDQRGRPTSCRHLAAASLALINQRRRGAWHVTDGGECTWYDFTCRINEITGAGCDVQPCTSAEFPRPARRPAYSVLDLSQTEAALGPMPHWHDNLAQVLDEASLPTRLSGA